MHGGGIFVCNCQHTLALDPRRFDLPTQLVQFATGDDDDLPAFADLVSRERCTHALIACCDTPGRFEDALRAAAGTNLTTHFINLKEYCFAVHDDPREAQDKAARLVRGSSARGRGAGRAALPAFAK